MSVAVLITATDICFSPIQLEWGSVQRLQHACFAAALHVCGICCMHATHTTHVEAAT